MAKYYTSRDINLFNSINKELLSEIIDTSVNIFKINQFESEENLYGEGLRNIYYDAVSVSGLIEHDAPDYEQDEFGVQSNSRITIKFHRKTLVDINLYLEVGDIIEWNDKNFEVNQINDNQLLAGRPNLKHSIICECNQTKRGKTKIKQIKRALVSEENSLYK